MHASLLLRDYQGLGGTTCIWIPGGTYLEKYPARYSRL
jgi:hypothetical protein